MFLVVSPGWSAAYYFCGSVISTLLALEIPRSGVRDAHSAIILYMGSANERRRCIATSSRIDWAHTQNDPWTLKICFTTSHEIWTCSWWRHDTETLSTLLALCEGNLPDPTTVLRNFDIYLLAWASCRTICAVAGDFVMSWRSCDVNIISYSRTVAIYNTWYCKNYAHGSYFVFPCRLIPVHITHTLEGYFTGLTIT